jgi:hypothetical protein
MDVNICTGCEIRKELDEILIMLIIEELDF